MARYIIQASITANVEISIEAKNEAAARKIFEEQISVTAMLADTPADKYEVNDDGITDHEIEDVRKED